MIDDDVILSPGWCPLCGEPQTICDSYGDCARAFSEATEEPDKSAEYQKSVEGKYVLVEKLTQP